MKTEHTSGPWISQTNESSSTIRITDSATEGMTIAEVPVGGARIGIKLNSLAEERQANARLICYAPELERLLRAFLHVEREFIKQNKGRVHSDYVTEASAIIAAL